MGESRRAKSRGHSRIPRVIFVALICLLILADGAVALVVLEQIRWADSEVDRALRVTFVLQQLDNLAHDYAIDQRSYRVSGDERLLQAYRDGVAHIPALYARLHGLVGENADETKQLANLFRLIDQDTTALAATLTPIEMHFTDGRNPAELSQSIQRSSAIVGAIDSMQANETLSLLGNLSAVDARNTIMLGTVGFGAFGCLVLIIVIVNMMRQEAQRSERLAEAMGLVPWRKASNGSAEPSRKAHLVFCSCGGTTSISCRRIRHSAGCSATPRNSSWAVTWRT